MTAYIATATIIIFVLCGNEWSVIFFTSLHYMAWRQTKYRWCRLRYDTVDAPLSVKGRSPLGELVGNLGCQPGLATSFQLVRLVGCGL